jgi:N utilization substance protein B
MFSSSLKSIEKNKKEIEEILTSLEIKDTSLELIDKSILYFAINEMLYGDLDKPVALDESLRLSKKFSSPDSYKFINASLDKFLKII